MKSTTKILIIIAVCCIGAGLIVFSAAIAVLENGRSVFKYEMSEIKTVNVTELFDSIEINEIMCDIEVLPSYDGQCRVVYRDVGKFIHQKYPYITKPFLSLV